MNHSDRHIIAGQQPNFSREDIDAFHTRQKQDHARHQAEPSVYRRTPFHERYAQNIEDAELSDPTTGDSSESGEEGWRTSDGDRLGDFGVDEEAEFYDEDDVPLAVLLERRRRRHTTSPPLGNVR